MLRFRHPARFAAALFLLAAAAVPATELAAFRPAAASRSVTFVCEDGVRFAVTYVDGGARITTAAGSWLLRPRDSSIGARYQSDRATFIHDRDRAALNGLPGGPFRGCREAGPLLVGIGAPGRRR